MKKLFLVVAVAGLCTVPGLASASDKGIATAWPSVSNSMTRFVKSTTLKTIAASLTTLLPGRFDRGVEGQGLPLTGLLLGDDIKPAEGSACPWCPEPPCG